MVTKVDRIIEKKRIEREIKMDVNVNENFAKRLRELREARGVGVRELANILGISHASISMYENCKREPTVSARGRWFKSSHSDHRIMEGLRS